MPVSTSTSQTHGLTRDELMAQERERVLKRVTMTLVSADLLRWLGGVSTIPDTVLEAGRVVLRQAQEHGDICDFRLYAFSRDAHLHINTFGQGLHHPAVQQLVDKVMVAVLQEAAATQLYRPLNGQDLLQRSAAERAAALRLRPLQFPYTERGAEPLFIAKVMHGATGAFNRMVFNMFFHPDKGSHQRLDGARFMALVEHVGDLVAGKTQRRLYAFGDRPLEEQLSLLYPYLPEPLELCREQVGDWAEMLSLIANPVEWVISAIYAVQGRFVIDGERWQATRHEPVVLVSVESLGAGEAATDPVAIIRLQGGLPAVGEAHANIGADFHFVIGGPDGGYHMGLMPVTMPQARPCVEEQGTAKLVAYTYQSYDDGRIPPEHDVVDVFAQDSVQTEWLQGEAREHIHWLVQHGDFQPYLTAEEAEKRAQGQAQRLGRLFESIPSTEQGETDPLVQQANERAGGDTLSDIKADAGGKVGHTSLPTLFAPVARASLSEAQEQGLVRDFRVFGVGDDMHLLMSHGHGVDANTVHLLAFQTFWRVVWVTEILGYKPYGLAQDLKIGPAMQGERVDNLAQPSDRFMVLLAEHLPQPERSSLAKMRAAQEAWKQGHGGVAIKKPFAGNVTGQGPGFAEMPLPGLSRIGVLAADKCGPAAFNLPVYQAAQRALAQPGFRARYGQSLAFEIYDVHNHRRVFLDARAHREEIAALLGATNLFNIKRLWSLPQVVTAPETVKSAVQDILLAASTEKLALITGGEYVGKDDPVLLGVEELVVPMYEYMQTGFYMTQGDERGSHYMMLIPKPLPEAIATVRSRGLQVGLMVALNGGSITEMHDVFAEPSYRAARIRIESINTRFWKAQGSEFTPIGVGARDVEPAYPLMKVLNRITGADSPYAQAIESVTREMYQRATQNGSE